MSKEKETLTVTDLDGITETLDLSGSIEWPKPDPQYFELVEEAEKRKKEELKAEIKAELKEEFLEVLSNYIKK